MRSLMISLSLLILAPLVAAATPVSISVEPWKTVDGNFGFSALHSATGAPMTVGGMDLYASGSIEYAVSGPTQFLSGDLTGSVLSLDASSLQLDGGSVFNIEASVLDFGVASGGLIGSLGYELVDVGGSVETGAFYFYNFDLTNGSCDANGLCPATGQYRLWGNNWENAVANRPLGNVSIDGQVASRFRGIDLGGDIVSAPVPEPGAALLFAVGSVVAGGRFRRRR